ncbi:30S ribosomal protein S18 [Sulfurospirillum sp. 1307]
MAPERRKYARKYCKYCEAKIDYIDYKDTKLLKQALSERYKIMPRRLTGTCKKHQEMVELAIKRARHTALIPYIIDRKKVVAHPFDLLQG